MQVVRSRAGLRKQDLPFFMPRYVGNCRYEPLLLKAIIIKIASDNKGFTLNFQHLKMGLVYATGLEKDALHIYAGVSIYLFCLLLLRRYTVKSGVLALLVTTAIALMAEVLDLRYTLMANDQLYWAASLHDLINTCLLPYMLFALNKWTTLFHPSGSKAFLE